MKDTLNPDVPSLLGSRICHDLISPLGAIGNGLELLEMSGDITGPEMELIKDSVRNATARIRMFRLAFGGADALQMISGQEMAQILHDIYHGSRIKIICDLPDTLDRPRAKLLMLLALCIENALPVGGKITIAANATEHMVQADGDKIAVNETLWNILGECRDEDALRAADVHFALAAEMANRLGHHIRVKTGNTSLRARF